MIFHNRAGGRSETISLINNQTVLQLFARSTLVSLIMSENTYAKLIQLLVMTLFWYVRVKQRFIR